MQFRGGPNRLHASRKAIEKYGTIEGCFACAAIWRKGHLLTKTGRLGHNHTETCRNRIKGLMADDLEYRTLMQQHQQSGETFLAEKTVEKTDIDVISTEYLKERIGNVKKAIHLIKQKMEREQGMGVGMQLDQIMLQMVTAGMDVAEFYSPPRVIQLAQDMGLRAGWSLDFTTNDEDGRAWNFNDAEMRHRAARKVLEDKPLLLIGSPTCTVFSTMNFINHSRMSTEEVEARYAYARRHLEFSTRLYKMQMDAGRYFLHGHRHAAISWQEDCIRRILGKHGVVKVVGDQCMYGFISRDKQRRPSEETDWVHDQLGMYCAAIGKAMS